MPLVVVGNWGKSIYGSDLKKKYENHPNLYVLDPIYDQRELDLLRGNAPYTFMVTLRVEPIPLWLKRCI